MTKFKQPIVFVEPVKGSSYTLPVRASHGAAGYDVCSNEKQTILPGAIARVTTGLKLAIPEGYEAQVRPRSGLAAKNGVTVLNAPGTIDSDFRGEVCIILINHGKEPFAIEAGMRIAQLVFAKYEAVGFEEVQNLEATVRGEGGFGSTGHGSLGK